MRKSRVLLLVCIFALAFSGVANAALGTWFGGVGNWEVNANWPDHPTYPNAIPDQANLISGTATINTAIQLNVGIIGFGVADLVTEVIIAPGASLTTGSEVIVGIGAGSNSAGVLTVEGTGNLGSLRVAGEVAGSTDFVNVNGGTLNVTAFGTYIGTRWDDITYGVGTVDIYNSGTVAISGMGAMGNRIDIHPGSTVNLLDSGSVLKLLGNYVTELQGWIDAGRVTGRDLAVYMPDGWTYAVPEPATLVLLGLGGLLLRRKR